MKLFNEPQNMRDLAKLTEKILRSEAPGMRQVTLVDAYHIVEENDIVSFVVYDKSPIALEDGLQYERRWVVVVTLQDEEADGQSWSKSRGIVSVSWDTEDTEHA